MYENDKVNLEIDKICYEFNKSYLNKHKTIYNITKLSDQMIQDLYPEIIKQIVINSMGKSNVKYLIKTLTQTYMKFNIPYEVLNKEFSYLQITLLRMVLSNFDTDLALKIINCFEDIHILLNEIYLEKYLNVLIRNNELRIKTIHSNIDDDIISFYEAHIMWVNQLATSILKKDYTTIPEKNHNKCSFGKWLNSDKCREIVVYDEDYSNLYEIHKKLHSISDVVHNLLKSKEIYSHEYLAYVYKSENISKDIGIKLTALSNQIVINKATKDPLTGVLNRELLKKLFIKEYELHATTDNNMLFAMCDLDHFKEVNDTYGHVAGDKVLKSFASILQEELRATDIIVRFGGEEFVIILPSVNLFNGTQILDNVRKKLKEQILIYEEEEIQITVSMGIIEIKPKIILCEDDIVNKLEDAIKGADILLYKAKHNGRDRIEV